MVQWLGILQTFLTKINNKGISKYLKGGHEFYNIPTLDGVIMDKSLWSLEEKMMKNESFFKDKAQWTQLS